MFKTTVPDDINLQYTGDSFEAPKAASIYDLYQLGMIPNNPTNDTPVQGSIISDMFDLENKKGSGTSQMSDTFNWDKSGAAQYVDDRHFSTTGFNPSVCQQKD